MEQPRVVGLGFQSRVNTKGRDARIWLVPKPSCKEKGFRVAQMAKPSGGLDAQGKLRSLRILGFRVEELRV